MATTPTVHARHPATDGDGIPADVFELVTRALNVAYYEWLPRTDAVSFSPALLDLFGYDPGVWTERRYWEAIHPDDRPGYRAARIAYLKGSAERAEFTYRVRMASGDYCWLRDQTVVERDVAGRVTRLVGAVSDITEARRREADYGERIEHQAATIDVLKVMSASPGDPQPVFDLIATRARDICDGYGVAVYGFDGTLIHLRAMTGVSEDPLVRDAVKAMYPMLPAREWPVGRAILDRRPIRIDDFEAEPGLHPAFRSMTVKSSVTIPIMRGDMVIGALGLGSRTRGGFSDNQIELLKTFAEQAVIAISSAETYRALQTRTAELTARDVHSRALIARQEASIEVLRAISTSPDDAQPVLDLILHHARTLCNAQTASFVEYDGTLLHQRARVGFEHDPEALAQLLATFPRPPGPETVPGRVVLSGQPVHIPDAQNDLGIFRPGRGLGTRSFYAMPLLREGHVIGVLGMGRYDPGEYDQSAIELVQSFAEQAVIAISSASALRELRQRTSDLQESLEYQTATSEVLKVISRSAFDLSTVLQTVVTSAVGLCRAERASLYRYRDGLCHFEVGYNNLPEYEALERANPIAAGPETLVGRTMAAGATVQIADALNDSDYKPKDQAQIGDVRSMLGVPLLRDGVLLGVFGLAKTVVEPFTDRQIELVRTFADQAVIAIENTRLITEQREALEQQTATAEVLQVINASPGNLTPVFDAILEKAMRLCGAAFGSLYTYDGQRFHSAAQRGVPDAYAEFRAANPPEVRPLSGPARLLETRRPVHIQDVRTSESYLAGNPSARALADLGGARSNLLVPLLKDEAGTGLHIDLP